MGRLVRYNAATSLNGYIAPPNHSTGWIIEDASIDFVKLYDEFDVFVMGRKTYEVTFAMGPDNLLLGRPKDNIVVVSERLDPAEHPDVTVLGSGFIEHVEKLKSQPGRDIWVMGGGRLASAFLQAELLDTVEVAVMPVLLQSGFTLFEDSGNENRDGRAIKLVLRDVQRLDQSGIVMTRYNVAYAEKTQQG